MPTVYIPSYHGAMKFSSYGNDELYSEPEVLRENVWEELNERRRMRRCARCGTTAFFYIKEITKHVKYEFVSEIKHKDNSLDEKAIISGSHVCTSCSEEIVHGLLGSASKTMEPSNEDIVRDKYRRIIMLCGIRGHLVGSLTTHQHREYHIKTRRDEPENIDLKLKENTRAMDLIKEDLQKTEGAIDDLVNLYRLK